MGVLAERIESISVHARAPGVDIEATLRNYTDITLSLAESVYDFIGEPQLEQALSGLARLLHAGWVRQYQEALDGTGVSTDPIDRHDRNFLEERDAIQAYGSSNDKRVTLSTVGLNDFSTKLKSGTVRELTESEFVVATKEAVAALLESFQSQARELHERYYGE